MDKMLDYQKAKEAYLQWMKIRHYSHATLETTANRLKPFEAFLEVLGKTDLRLVLETDLREYHAMVMAKPWSQVTKSNCLSMVRSFFQYLVAYEWLLFNPVEKLNWLIRPRKALPEVWSEKTMQALLASVSEKEWLGVRDRAILEILYSCGLRLKEIMQLKIEDVDLTTGLIFIEDGKGGKDRVVPIGKEASFWVQKYLCELRPLLAHLCPEGKALFIGIKGKAVTESVIQHLVHKYARKAGFRKRIYPHLFRHTMATHLLIRGAPIHMVQGILGHSQLTSTHRYTHLDKEQLRKVFEKYHPRGKWTWESRK